MNQNTRIRVQTPVGMTDFKDTGEGLGQGTTEGAIASAVNLDNGVQDFLRDSEDEVFYYGLIIFRVPFKSMNLTCTNSVGRTIFH